MAKLPNADQCFVPETKLGGYLMSETHPQGAPKWAFLQSFGFDGQRPDELRAALVRHGAAYEAAVFPTQFGVKSHVDGPLETPSGRAPLVRTVWQVDPGETAPRFVTMRPLRNA